MRFKIITLSILFILLSSSLVFAEEDKIDTFTVEIGEMPSITVGEPVTFEVKIKNHAITSRFTINSFPYSWIRFEIEGASGTPSPRLAPGEEITITGVINLPEDIRPTTYLNTLIVNKHATEEKIEQEFLTRVLQVGEKISFDDLKISCSQCLDEVEISGKIENIGVKKSSDIKLILNLGGDKREIEIDEIDRGKFKTFREVFSLSELKPNNYAINAKILINNIEHRSESLSFLKKLITDLNEKENMGGSVFGNSWSKTLTNKGNDKDEIKVESEVDDRWWVLYLGPVPDERDGSKVTWYATLEPGETTSIGYTELYWPVPILLVLMILGGLYGAKQSGALVVNKRVSTRNDGTCSVSLGIKNRGGTIEGTVVRDIIPEKYGIRETFETIKPTVRRSVVGTELLWRVGKIKSKEERVLHYELKPREQIVRNVKLPTATASAVRGMKTVSSRSNEVTIPAPNVQTMNVDLS